MSAPLFSIVTVTLNCADDAVRTAQSVLAQDFGDYEYLAKDGGSQDNTVERLRDLGVLVYGSPDVGIYDAMNQALALCKGDYVYFLNGGDTFFDNHVLSRVAKQLDPTAAVVYGDVVRQPWGSRTNYPPTLSRYYLFRKNICHQAWMARRDLYVASQGFNLSYSYAADQEFLWRAVLRRHLPVQHIEVILADFVYGGYSTSKSNEEAVRQERWHLLRKFYAPWEVVIYGVAGLYFMNRLKSRVSDMFFPAARN